MEFAYLRHGGHTETVFCCDVRQPPFFDTSALQSEEQTFCVMATGSYDGTIKLWDLTGSTNLPKSQTSQTLASAGLGSNDLENGFRCALNGLWVGKNVLGTKSASRSANGTELGLDVTLVDSFPPLEAGRASEDGMKTKYGIWYSVSWAPDQFR